MGNLSMFHFQEGSPPCEDGANKSINLGQTSQPRWKLLSLRYPSVWLRTDYCPTHLMSSDFSFEDEVGFGWKNTSRLCELHVRLESDDYLLRAYVTSYVQLEEVRVHVANETTLTRSEIPLIRTGIFNVTVHFKNSASIGSTMGSPTLCQMETAR